MTQEELSKYIRKKLRTGYPAGELENELLARGVSQDQIRQVMNHPRNSWTSASITRNIMIMNIVCILIFIGLKVILNLNIIILACIFLAMVVVLPVISIRMSKKDS